MLNTGTASAMRCWISLGEPMGKRKQKKAPIIHPMFLGKTIKPVELPKPKDPCHDEGFETALIEWIKTHREKWREKWKSGEP
jgi:hypothetical protein